MDLSASIKRIADEIDGSFSEYSADNLIITVPVDGVRYQGVTTYLIERNGMKVIEFTSKVCEVDANLDIDVISILKLHQELTYSKVVIHEGFIQVASAIILKHSTYDILKDIVLEVGKTADRLEHELTGGDVH